MWIDVLLSAGIEVEICKVKAKEMNPATLAAKKRKRPSTGVKKESVGSMQSIDVDAEEDEEDKETGEFEYESGEEGKGEGRWEKRGKG